MEKIIEQRSRMVEEQLKARGIFDERVLDAMLKIPREEFVPRNAARDAYGDHPLPIGEGQTISQPYMVALMVEKLALKGNERVLEIGTGSGYQAAVLACLSRDVYTLERIPGLAQSARENLNRLRQRKVCRDIDFDNIVIKEGNGYFGLKEFSPYQAIIVACAISETPPALIEQLDEGGRLVIPLGGSFVQELTLIKKRKGKLETENICGCVFVPLIGGEGK